ncbi:MAG: hypothetical protein C5B56_13975 [Proteobacteria bacterium]|nr:MAG: hypothetical protein C5B56_13975 [Pseudomonadota bacterium]
MVDLLLLAEDDAQEKFVGTLIRRIAQEKGVPLEIRVRSSRTGYGGVLLELQALAKACASGKEIVPDLVVVAVDANCKGPNERRGEVEARAGDTLRDRLVSAIADPHVERWFLLDGAAFNTVLGRGCQAPDQKCEKDRYKGLLIQAVLDAGIEPLLGGIEYAEDLAYAMDLRRAAGSDAAFARFIAALGGKLGQMQRSA